MGAPAINDERAIECQKGRANQYALARRSKFALGEARG